MSKSLKKVKQFTPVEAKKYKTKLECQMTEEEKVPIMKNWLGRECLK